MFDSNFAAETVYWVPCEIGCDKQLDEDLNRICNISKYIEYTKEFRQRTALEGAKILGMM